MSRASNRHYQAVTDLVPDRLILILFAQGLTIMAEVIGPPGYEDAIEPMPDALTTAFARLSPDETLLVLDDENLWQVGWGALEQE